MRNESHTNAHWRSRRNDCEEWWMTKVIEVEKASVIFNAKQLFRLIREKGGKRIIISKTVSEISGSLISSRDRRLRRWKKHFEEQFNWPATTFDLPTIQRLPEWDVDTGPPSITEITKAVGNMKWGEEAGLCGASPVVFEDGGDELLSGLTKVIDNVWEEVDF